MSRQKLSTCRGMEPGQSKNIREPARADTARGMATLEPGVTAYVKALGQQPISLNHIY